MPRPKTVSDEHVLAAARRLFLQDGAAASTREIAKAAGISEAVIFQRFGTKDDLFFAAMTPPAPDLDAVFDVRPGRGRVRANLERITLRILGHFRQAIPVVLPLITHPAFDAKRFLKGHGLPAIQIRERLAAYLSQEAEAGRVAKGRTSAAADLLISHLHNHALMETVGGTADGSSDRVVAEAVAVLWEGLAP